MTRGIEIIREGLLTTVQDRGRLGYQQIGMVVSGAMDQYAYQMANLLVGNSPNEAALEMTLYGPTIQFYADHLIAICGGSLEIYREEESLPVWQTIKIKNGDVLRMGRFKQGCRAYLAISGGMQIPKVLDSYSTYLKGKIGGWKGRALQKGDFIPTLLQEKQTRWRSIRSISVHPDLRPHYHLPAHIRVIMGPQQEYFTKQGRDTFLNGLYTVTPAADRMGYRLEGPRIEWADQGDMISDAVPMGGIQVPANGLPIVLMADRQPTGGYPKIGTVISLDIPLLAQLKPGDQLSFQSISIEEAQRLYRIQENQLRMLAKLR